MKWHSRLHWRILIGLGVGLIYGIGATFLGLVEFTDNWITPFGTIFVNSLKLIAVPLVLGSLVTGVASLSDIRSLSRIGGKTIAIYVTTTAIAVVIGLLLVNLVDPGDRVPAELKAQLQTAYSADVSTGAINLAQAKAKGPLGFLVDLVPENFLDAASDNSNMLQVVVVAILVGVGLVQLDSKQSKPLLDLFASLSSLVIRLVDLIMLFAPIGVFALIAGTIVNISGGDPSQVFRLLSALGMYGLTVIGGLVLHVMLVSGGLLWLFSDLSLRTFLAGIAPAQLVAFSTSSSGATLPVTMERVEEKLGVSRRISSFVLPLGATVNMDGLAVYQGVAAVFIAQSLGIELGVGEQMIIVGTAILASIGTPAVPGAGLVMLMIVLEAVGMPGAAVGLILGIDRILDMLRTVVNVTGDAVVAVVIASAEGEITKPDLSEANDEIRVSKLE